MDTEQRFCTCKGFLHYGYCKHFAMVQIKAKQDAFNRWIRAEG